MACPFLYLAVSLSSGIILGSRLAHTPVIILSALLISLCSAWLAYSLKKNTLSLGLVLLATLILGAAIHTHAKNENERNSVKRLDLSGYTDFYGRLYRSPSLGLGRTTVFLRTEKIAIRGREVEARGNLRVSVLHPSAYPSPLEVRSGDRVRISAQLQPAPGLRNFGAPRMAELRRAQRVHGQAFAKSALLVEKHPPSGPVSPACLISSLRRTLGRRVEDHFSLSDRTALSKQGAVLEALLLGERGRMDEAMTSSLQGSGLYHLMAISGAHIGIISIIILGILRIGRVPRRPSYVVLIVFLVFYALMVEGRASVMRATIMALTYLSGKLLWEQTRVVNTIAFSAFVLLLINPFSLSEPGFEMTYAATLSIVLFYPKVSKVLCRLPLRIGELLALSLTAQLGVLPLVACFFNRVTFSSFILNIPAIPLVGLIMGLGFAFLAISPVSSALAALLVPVINFLVNLFLWISRLGSAFPALSYRIPTPSPAVVIGYYIFLLSLLFRPRLRPQRFLGVSLFAAFMAVIVTHPFPPRPSSALRVTFLDVGQGESILVEFPGKKKMLVDGGGGADSSFDIGEQVVSPFLWSCGIKKLDYLVLTHAHPDHLHGLVAVASNFRVAEFWEAFSPEGVPAYEELKKKLPKSTFRRRVFRGFRLQEGSVTIEALHPEISAPIVGKVNNDDSLVLRLTSDGISILLAADIGRASERAIADDRVAVRSQVLKSPHHGSRTSSSAGFLDAVEPRVVVISAGYRNPYSVPHPEILERYAASGAFIFRTDIDGAIEMTVRDPGLCIRTAASRAPPD